MIFTPTYGVAYNLLLYANAYNYELCALAYKGNADRVCSMTDLARSPKHVGAALRRRRKSIGLTQSELAERAGIRQATVSLMESGTEGVKLSTVMDVLRVLDLEIVLQSRTKGSHADIEDMF